MGKLEEGTVRHDRRRKVISMKAPSSALDLTFNIAIRINHDAHDYA